MWCGRKKKKKKRKENYSWLSNLKSKIIKKKNLLSICTEKGHIYCGMWIYFNEFVPLCDGTSKSKNLT